MIDDRPLRRLAATQRGLVTVTQAIGLGYDRPRRRRLIDGRRWERVTARVVRLVGAEQSPAQHCLLAILDAGGGAALSGASAAAWWNIPGNQLEPIHVARWRDRSATAHRSDERHAPRLLPDHHVVTLDGIPVQVPARALFDIAGTRRRGVELPWWVARMERMVDNAWSARLVSGTTMHAMLEDLAQRGRPGIRVMRAVLAKRGVDYVPPASNLEARVIQILEEGAVPPMRRQVNTGDEQGLDRPSRPAGRRAASDRRGPERAVPLQPDRPAARRSSASPAWRRQASSSSRSPMSTCGIARVTCCRPCWTVDVGLRPFAEPPAESEPTANRWVKCARNDALHPRVRDPAATRGRNVSGTTHFAHGFAGGGPQRAVSRPCACRSPAAT